MDSAGIYVIEQIGTDRFYIGSSVRVSARWYEHRRVLNRGKHHSPYLQNAWNKYGPDAFDFYIVEACEPDKESLLLMEQAYLIAFDPPFNVCPTAGSRLGSAVREESKAKISAGLTGFKRPPRLQCVNGHPFDDANTKVDPKTGYRSCRTCARERALTASRAKGAQPKDDTVCKNGHPWTEETAAIVTSRGRTARYCRICRAAWGVAKRRAAGARDRKSGVCKRGHARTPENVNGSHGCRLCTRLNEQARRAASRTSTHVGG